MTICPACQEELPDDARYCGACRFRLTPITSRAGGVPVASGGPDFADTVRDGRLPFADTVPNIKTMTTPPARTGEEARKCPRFPLLVSVTYESAHNFFAGQSRNIGTGGLFVSTDEPAPAGSTVRLTLTLPGLVGSWTAECEVAWSRDRNGPEMTGMGLRFVRLAPEVKRAIECFVRHREPLLVEE